MRRRIPIFQLERSVSKGLGVSEIAKELGFSKGSVSKALKRLNVAVTKDVALRSAPELVAKGISALDQLQKINDYANELLDLLMRWNRGDDEALQILESQVRKVRVGKGKDAELIKQYRFKDPRELALRAMSEIRGQLQTQMELFKTLYNAEEVAKFQQIVMEEIGHAAPEVRDKILQRLNERRAVRSTLSFP